MPRPLVALVLVGSLTVAGCGKQSGFAMGSLFRDVTGDTAPRFTPSATTTGLRSARLVGATAWGPGNALYDIFLLMREYESPRDEGKVDMTNMYKVLSEAARYGDAYTNQCQDATFAPKVIPAPYPGFDAGQTYTCAGNDSTTQPGYAHGWAYLDDGNTKSMLIGFMWGGNTGGGALGAIQASFDETASSLALDMVTCVNCGQGTSSFTVRSSIAGSPGTHAFDIRTVLWPWNGTSGYRSINGKGVSQGAGQFFLLRMQTDASAPRYYCIPGSATEDDLKALDPAGTDVPDAGCAGYQGDVDAMVFFTDADVPKAPSDFTGSTILLAL